MTDTSKTSLTHLLKTKLHAPGVDSRLVSRPHLWRLLDQGRSCKLTLVTAPAGFGKSSLLSEWLSRQSLTFGWVSLDERDNDLVRFLEYVICAVSQIHPDACASTWRYIHETRDFSAELAMTLFINGIQAVETDFILVLDDYHAITNASIHHAVSFLLEYMPRNLHLYVASRAEPALHLSGLFAKRQLVRIAASELRFTPSEIRSLFALTAGITLSEGELDILEHKTEGWAAGLHMVLLSSSRGDRPAYAEHAAAVLAADESDTLDGSIADYLVEEVLAGQPPEVQRFLLKTSVLERMNASLCEHVTGDPDSRALLEHAERAGLFVIPLDTTKTWYRYHHMFSRMLKKRLMRDAEDTVPELRGRASEWFSRNGYTVEAIEYALAAADYDTAIRIMMKDAAALLKNEMHMLLHWIRKLPRESILHNPQIAVLAAWSLATFEHFQEAEAVLDFAEPYIDKMKPDLPAFTDEDLYGYFAAMRCLICLGRNETEQALAYSKNILERLGGVGTISAQYIVNYNHNGESLLRGKFGFYGGLKQTLSIYPPLIEHWKAPHDHFYGYLHTVLGECLYERNDIPKAEEYLAKGAQIGFELANPGIFVPALLATARIALARGEQEAALAVIDEARDRIRATKSLQFLPAVDAFHARMLIRIGQMQDAFDWAERCLLQVDGTPDPSREFEQITLLRVFAAQGDITKAYRYAERLLQAYDFKRRAAAVVELKLIQALMLERRDDLPAALNKLEQALRLAFQERHVRLFLDEGTNLARLLTVWAKQEKYEGFAERDKDFQAYVSELSAGFAGAPPIGTADKASSFPGLTTQELKVLKLLSQGYDNKEIAAQLFITYETVKKHCKNMYRKLSVSSRNQAVALYHLYGEHPISVPLLAGREP